ncbi:hypothetical protein CK203_053965 [Vitis vinifera]|uniref:Aspartic peptidase DDI1-type domain-containing protein n=1 Tax=Vitis vinifera TaxID=29760 RepID=A0A438H8I7_VITVI|nr:hypothetical protein CK203_053965 [Vitis vinifera]
MKAPVNPKSGMYMLSEDMDMKAKVATMARALEELELKKMHEVQAISETQPMHAMHHLPIMLTNLNTVNEKGKFPFQPSQNPKGVHEVETQDGESSKLREVKAVITLRSGKEVDQPLPKVRQDEELISKRTLVKESNSQEEKSGKKRLVHSQERVHVTKKAFLTEQVSAIIQSKSPVKYKDPGCPTISVNIGGTHVEKALLDLGASVGNIPRGMIEDVLVQVDKFYYSVDFVVLDTDPTVKEANCVPIILGRPFLATSNAIINCRNGVMQLTFGNMTLELNIFHLMQEASSPTRGGRIGGGVLDQHLAIMSPWRRREEILPLFNKEDSQGAAMEDPPKLVLKPLPVDLKYAYLEEDEKCPMVVSSNLIRISPLVCTHHIYMEEDAKPVRQPQRRLNPHMQEVVRGEVLKLLQVGIIYPISDSFWVSPTDSCPIGVPIDSTQLMCFDLNLIRE